MRVVLILLWGLLLAMVFLALLPRRRPENRRRGVPDELVKDPVCQAYILRSRAVVREDNGVLRHFCGPECARQFVHSRSGSRG